MFCLLNFVPVFFKPLHKTLFFYFNYLECTIIKFNSLLYIHFLNFFYHNGWPKNRRDYNNYSAFLKQNFKQSFLCPLLTWSSSEITKTNTHKTISLSRSCFITHQIASSLTLSSFITYKIASWLIVDRSHSTLLEKREKKMKENCNSTLTSAESQLNYF